MHNPFEELVKKVIFLLALGYMVASTETFQQTMNFLSANKKIIEDTKAVLDGKAPASTKSNMSKNEVKTNTR